MGANSMATGDPKPLPLDSETASNGARTCSSRAEAVPSVCANMQSDAHPREIVADDGLGLADIQNGLQRSQRENEGDIEGEVEWSSQKG